MARALAQSTIDRLIAAGWRVHRSEWQATGGIPGVSWFVTDPQGDRLPDDAGTERDAWRMARDAQARLAASGFDVSIDPEF